MQRLRTPQRQKRSMKRRFRYMVLSLVSVAGLLIVARGLTHGQGSLVAPLAHLKQSAGDVHYSKLIPEGDKAPIRHLRPERRLHRGWRHWLARVFLDYRRLQTGRTLREHSSRAFHRWRRALAVRSGAEHRCRRHFSHGRWQNSVRRARALHSATLVHDPTDPNVGARWKLFVHRYFWTAQQDRIVDYGWIALRTAADPAGA
jgi:hypothetical protein